jgi:membrane protease YdiL (CAAX protease family)
VRPRLSDVGYTLIGFGAYFGIYVALSNFVSNNLPQVDLNQRQDLGFSTSASGVDLLPIFISLVILPPLVEELVVRGVLYSGLRTRLMFVPAALITSAVFALAHLNGGVNSSVIWVASLDTFVLSMVLVSLREKTGSLWPGIWLHGLKNGIAFLALYILHLG